jgi:hypothetical protein
MATLSNIFPAFPAPKFYCNICDYGTSRKSNYGEHLLSAKHKRQSIGNVCQPISSKIQQIKIQNHQKNSEKCGD